MLLWGNFIKIRYSSHVKKSVMFLWAPCVIPLLSPIISSLLFYFSKLPSLSISPISAPIILCLMFYLSPFLLIHRPASVCSIVTLWGPHPHIHGTTFQSHVSDMSEHGREIEALSWPQPSTSRVHQRVELLEGRWLSCPGGREQRTGSIQLEANRN